MRQFVCMNTNVDENRSYFRKNSVLTRAQVVVNVIYHYSKSDLKNTFSIRKRTSLVRVKLLSVSEIVNSTPEYTGFNRRNGPDFGRVFLRSNYTDITQNTYIQS